MMFNIAETDNNLILEIWNFDKIICNGEITLRNLFWEMQENQLKREVLTTYYNQKIAGEIILKYYLRYSLIKFDSLQTPQQNQTSFILPKEKPLQPSKKAFLNTSLNQISKTRTNTTNQTIFISDFPLSDQTSTLKQSQFSDEFLGSIQEQVHEIKQKEQKELQLKQEMEKEAKIQQTLNRQQNRKITRQFLNPQIEILASQNFVYYPYNQLEQLTQIKKNGLGPSFIAYLQGTTKCCVKSLSSIQPTDISKIFDQCKKLNTIKFDKLCPILGYSIHEDMFLGLKYDFLIIKQYFPYDLDTVLKENMLTYKEKIRIMIQLIEALDYLHNLKQPIYHYDLKPSNILLDEDFNAYITEYGLANYVEIMQTKTLQVCHSYFSSPEQLSVKPRVTATSDIWSLGLIYFTMFYGYLPEEKLKDTKIQENSDLIVDLAGGLIDIIDKPLFGEIKLIIEKMVQFKPSNRWPIKKLMQNFSVIQKKLL